jgi:predicted RNA-binding Zn-ribbon protein involved in translation (DUF1610 family)
MGREEQPFLLACPDCGAWPMAASLARRTNWGQQGRIKYLCSKCGHHEIRDFRSFETPRRLSSEVVKS